MNKKTLGTLKVSVISSASVFLVIMGVRYEQAIAREDEDRRMRTFQVREVAKLLGVATSTVYDMARQRKIAHRRIGTGKGRIVFTEQDVEEFLSSCKVEAASLSPALKFTHGR